MRSGRCVLPPGCRFRSSCSLQRASPKAQPAKSSGATWLQPSSRRTAHQAAQIAEAKPPLPASPALVSNLDPAPSSRPDQTSAIRHSTFGNHCKSTAILGDSELLPNIWKSACSNTTEFQNEQQHSALSIGQPGQPAFIGSCQVIGACEKVSESLRTCFSRLCMIWQGNGDLFTRPMMIMGPRCMSIH